MKPGNARKAMEELKEIVGTDVDESLRGRRASPCSEFRERVEMLCTYRLDLLKQRRELKDQIDLIGQSIDDTVEEWREHRIEEWVDWVYGVENPNVSADAMYERWEKDNPEYQVVGNHLRKRPQTNDGGNAGSGSAASHSETNLPSPISNPNGQCPATERSDIGSD